MLQNPAMSTESKSDFVARVNSIAKTIPSYNQIVTGDTVLQCSKISNELQKALAQNGIETLYVGAENDIGQLRHNYLLAKINGQTIIIDPTISQFIPDKREIFIGSRQEIMAIAQTSLNPNSNWSHVWAEHPVSPNRTGIPTSRLERDLFNQQWKSTGAVVKDYPPSIPSSVPRLNPSLSLKNSWTSLKQTTFNFIAHAIVIPSNVPRGSKDWSNVKDYFGHRINFEPVKTMALFCTLTIKTVLEEVSLKLATLRKNSRDRCLLDYSAAMDAIKDRADIEHRSVTSMELKKAVRIQPRSPFISLDRF